VTSSSGVRTTVCQRTRVPICRGSSVSCNYKWESCGPRPASFATDKSVTTTAYACPYSAGTYYSSGSYYAQDGEASSSSSESGSAGTASSTTIIAATVGSVLVAVIACIVAAVAVIKASRLQKATTPRESKI
jgi:hypothetical protein